MNDQITISHCGTNSYGAWIDDCERRSKRGERQSYCWGCGKWQWPGVVCCGGDRVSEEAFAAEVRRSQRAADRYEKALDKFESQYFRSLSPASEKETPR